MTSTEQKIAAQILYLEDNRATGPDSLRVTRLPAADKGGDWEICGICDGIEPAVFRHLKSLLDAGKKEKAWEASLQYVLDNTQAVRTWLGAQDCPAVEFFLRDFFFNAGIKSASLAVQRAVNARNGSLKEDGIAGPATRSAFQAALTANGETVMLMLLHRFCEQHYRSCKQWGAFGKGWINRLDAAASFAAGLLR
ncbi:MULTISPECIES: hypothetical protein [Akkermansia]|uniref:hypothetical protein n=1 Tax=Akkermansia TaxID=239934 RepID=UPI001F432B31|nr:hypothetical protein [Akkermansia muciniphila]MCI7762466.1 hypothetical protein [Akkermansia muciniphila]MDY5392356.1 hypothetical protein [Akkermansia muciniphila]